MTKVKEIWKDIPGYEGLYQASSVGRIKRLKVPTCAGSQLRKERSKFRPEKMMVLINNRGYNQTSLCHRGKVSRFRTHRLIALAFIPNPENKPFINHKNGIKNDNRIENLEWCTAAENNRHASEIGLLPSGEDVYLSVLTNENVIDIRRKAMDRNRHTVSELSKKFNVQQACIYRVIKRKTWKHI